MVKLLILASARAAAAVIACPLAFYRCRHRGTSTFIDDGYGAGINELGSRLIKSTRRELRRGRWMRGSFERADRSAWQFAGSLSTDKRRSRCDVFPCRLSC